MAPLTQSPFLQALGYALVNSLWQFALLWLIYVALNTLMKLSAHQKYTTGMLIHSAGFAWFVATFFYYLQQFLKFEEIYFWQQKKLSLPFTISQSPSFLERFFAGIMQTANFLPYLSIAYLLILIFLSARWIKIYRVTQTIKTKGLQKADLNWRLFVKKLSVQLGIKHEVKIYLSERVKTPLTIGFFKPLILIPLASLNQLNTYQMEAVILHELAHIKRFDYLFNLFVGLIDITLFFNPFAILISRHLKHERENCCDDWVLQYEYSATSYASALLQIATHQTSAHFTLQAANNKYILLKRIKRMIEKKENTFFNYRYQFVALSVMLTVAGSLALLSSLPDTNKAIIPTSSAPDFTKPLDEIVNNPLFNTGPFIALSQQKNKKENTLSSKNLNTNFYPDTIFNKKITTVTNEKIGKKPFLKRLPAKENIRLAQIPVKPKITDIPNSLITDNLVNSIETSCQGFEVPAVAIQEQRTQLEEQLKQLAIHFAEESKPTIDQKQLLEIKAAIKQLLKIKIQPDSEMQKLLNQKQKIYDIQVNQWKNDQLFSADQQNKLQRLTENLQFETMEFRRQAQRAAEKISFYKNNYGIAQEMFPLAAKEKSHSFSFEFSTDPRLQVVMPGSFPPAEKVKKIDKRFLIKKNENSNFKNVYPQILNELIEKDAKEKDIF